MHAMSATNSDIEDGLRAWAKGMDTTEAAVEVLIRAGRVHRGAPWLTDAGDGRVGVDVDQLVDGAGVLSGGERRLVADAASLLSGRHSIDLGDAVSGIERNGLDLVLAALAHASGSHEHSGFEHHQDGKPVGIIRHATLYPWPAK